MLSTDKQEITVIDGEGLVAGRLASVVAKKLLKGERIIIVNSEKIIISGKPKRIIEKYMKRISEWRTHYNPEKRGPKYPRRPDRLFKRMVRGMLPWKKPKGREAFKRLKVYMGVPKEYENVEKVKIKNAVLRDEKIPRMTLGELYKALTGGTSL